MNARYVQAPEYPKEILPRPFVFLAGGIPGCRDWQAEMSHALLKRLIQGTVCNPRRQIDWMDDARREEQITWEFRHLWNADIIAFWFSKPTLNPTTLFEFGTHTARRRCSTDGTPKILVGIDPGYAKERGVRTQTKLLDPEIEIVSGLDALTDQVVREAAIWLPKGDACHAA